MWDNRCVRRRWVAAAAVLVASAVAAAAGHSGSDSLSLGVAADSAGVVDEVSAAVDAPVTIHQWFQSWGDAEPFDVGRASEASARGALPMLTWEPWQAEAGAEQPAYRLSRIIGGEYDQYIADFARQVGGYEQDVALRVFHELNADFYPWGAGANSNTPADAQSAWRHVRAIFEDEGVDNVIWVWSVNVESPDTVPIAPLYPGDDLVDWVGVDGYNGGEALPWGGWRSPESIFGSTIAEVRAVSSRPVILSEVGSAEAGGSKGRWIAELFEYVDRDDIRSVVWFELDKETDWRIRSSPEAVEAFRREAANRDIARSWR